MSYIRRMAAVLESFMKAQNLRPKKILESNRDSSILSFCERSGGEDAMQDIGPMVAETAVIIWREHIT